MASHKLRYDLRLPERPNAITLVASPSQLLAELSALPGGSDPSREDPWGESGAQTDEALSASSSGLRDQRKFRMETVQRTGSGSGFSTNRYLLYVSTTVPFY